MDLSILDNPALLQLVKVPGPNDQVHKDECAYSHDNPYSPDGLFVSLHSFYGYGKEYVSLDHKKSKRPISLYLNLKKVAKPLPPMEEKGPEPPEKKPKSLAIGVEGGFDIGEKRIEYEDVNSLVILPDFKTVPLPNDTLPIMVNLSIQQILTSDSALKKEDLNIWVAEPKIVSKYANSLVQLNNGVKVPPRGWKCANCDLTENLWMNLTDGTILCGRKNWDGTGGNGHALAHFEATGYPLCVKLGTISSEGASDIFSYAENEMVEDPKIKEHLTHFGINMEAMQKTEKSIAELEIDQNLSYEFNRLQESGKELTPLYGPGYTGLYNIGSSCYLASVLQVIFSVPHFVDRYVKTAEEIFATSGGDPTADLQVQMAKLGRSLLSGKYSSPTTQGPIDGISPKVFKHLVGKGHPEFSTFKQQDAMEFYQHLLEFIDRKERVTGQVSPTIAFKFKVEDRVECQISHQVKYTSRIDNVLSVPVPLEAATNKEEVAAYELAKKSSPEPSKVPTVRPQIPLLECLKAFAAPEYVPDFYSSATKMKGPASKTTHLASFPPFLTIQVRKFTLGDDWVPKKLDICLDVPDELDLGWLRGTGPKPGEVELPEESAPAKAAEPKIEIDQTIVAQLIDMGFDPEGCKKAVYYTKNAGVEPAMNWVLEHMGDPDFGAPLALAQKEESSAAVNEEAVAMIESMGFNRKQAIKGLKATQNNLERAVDWLFNHASELDEMDVEEQPKRKEEGPKENVDDGPGHYRLFAIISHMGSSTGSGHYVCHIKKEGKWVLFNDSKVMLSEDLPKDLGYLYIYQRT